MPAFLFFPHLRHLFSGEEKKQAQPPISDFSYCQN